MNIASLLEQLTARMPELEWKIGALGNSLAPHALPRGLFHPRMEANAADYVAEIKADINILAAQKSEFSAHYLAQRIHQKINVLVTLCHIQANKKKPVEKIHFGVNSISTRQQWLQTLNHEIETLTAQQHAMQRSMEQLQVRNNTDAVLNLRRELGEVEKRLTLAIETFERASL